MSQKNSKQGRKRIRNTEKQQSNYQKKHNWFKLLIVSTAGIVTLVVVCAVIVSGRWHVPISYLPEFVTACHPIVVIKSSGETNIKPQTLFRQEFKVFLQEYQHDPVFGQLAQKVLTRISFWDERLQQLEVSRVRLRIILQKHRNPYTGEYNAESWFSQHLITSMLYYFSPRVIFIEGEWYDTCLPPWKSSEGIKDGLDAFRAGVNIPVKGYGTEDKSFYDLHSAVADYTKPLNSSEGYNLYQFHQECIYARNVIALISSLDHLQELKELEGFLIIGTIHGPNFFDLCRIIGLTDVRFYQGSRIYFEEPFTTRYSNFPWRFTD